MHRVMKNSLFKVLLSIVAFFGFAFTVNAAEYNISYNLNGGSASNQTTYDDEVGYTLNNPTKANYVFIGWTGSNGSTPQMSVTIPAGSTGDKSYTANYKKQVKLIVRCFDAANGSTVRDTVTTDHLEGDSYSVSTPTVDGYKLASAPAKTSGTFGTGYVYLDFYYDKLYTLSFDSKGGTPVDKVERTYGDGVQLSNYSSEKKGYTFDGWSSKKDGSDSFTEWQAKRNRTVYAKWLLENYTISYDLNGGTVDGENPASYTVESDDITLINPEKTNYQFIGWTGTDLTSPELNVLIRNGSTGDREYVANYLKFVKLIVRYYDNQGNVIKEQLVTDYLEGDHYVATPAEIEGYILDETRLPGNAEGDFGTGYIYVDYYYNESRTLTFETNGGSEIDSLEVEYGTKVNLNDYVPTRDGYDFMGWSSKADLSDDFTVWKGKTSRTVYAKWAPVEYAVTYDLDGGSVDGENPENYNIESDEFTLINPTKEGFEFIGWTGSNGDTPELEVVIPTGTTGDLSYVANWEQTTHTLTFETNGGSEIDPITEVSGTKVDLSDYVPVREGYDFLGWSSKADLSNDFTTWRAKKDRTVYAKWAPTEYTISYDLDGGSVDGENPESYNIESDDITLIAPEKEGYVFIGWTGSNGDTPELEVVIPTGTTEDLSYVANWEQITHVLTFETNGGSEIDSIEAEYGTKVDLSDYVPTRDGYDFMGWSSKADLSNDFTTWRAKKDRTVYAKWAPTEYTISYDLDGGSVDGENPESYNIESDDITLIAPEKEGYVFIGWTGSNGDTPELEVVIPTGTTEDLYYVANYLKEVKLIVRYLDNDGNPIAEEVVTDHLEGDWYTALNVKTIDGYRLNLLRLPRNTIGRFGQDDVYVDYYYNHLYTLTFETNGGSTINPLTNRVENSIVLLTGYNPTRDGYNFAGWYGNADLSGSRLYLISMNDNRTVYAKWNPIVYTITYDLNDGTVDGENPETYTIESDSITLINPTKEGYQFIGWTGSNGDTPELVVVIPTGSMGNLSYVANYLKEVKLIINYLDNQGNPLDEALIIDYLENDHYELPAAIEIDGYVLNEARLPEPTEGDFSTEDIIANYYYNKLCTLTFDTNGGLLIPAITDIVEGTEIDLSTIVPFKKDNKFLGWYLEPQFTNLVASVTVEDDTTIYANWQFIYRILAGANQTHVQAVDGGLLIVSNGDVSKLVAIEVDGKVIDSSNYTIVAGSTILTLHQDYLDSLSLGKHTVNFVYEDGSVDTGFTITKLPKAKTVSTDAVKYASGNPQTGDDVIVYVMMLIISMLALTTTTTSVLVNKE